MDYDSIVRTLNEKTRNINLITNETDNIKKLIHYFQVRLDDYSDYSDDDSYINDEEPEWVVGDFIRITKKKYNNVSNFEKCQLLQSIYDDKCLNKWKNLRSLYLYLNKNKKLIFGFNNKLWISKKKYWKTCFYKKNDLLAQIDDTINEGIMSNYKLEYLKLLRKNINDYRSDYGITIGLVLNRLFIPDIVSLIYQYI